MGSLRRGCCEGPTLKTYLLYIHDRRRTAPNLEVITVIDDRRACELAQERLDARVDYYRAEVWEDDRLVCRLGATDPA